jgi:hypothetical protein
VPLIGGAPSADDAVVPEAHAASTLMAAPHNQRRNTCLIKLLDRQKVPSRSFGA